MKTYAIYKKETCLAIGTIPEIAKVLGIKKKSVRFYGSPSYKKRTSEEKGLRLVRC